MCIRFHHLSPGILVINVLCEKGTITLDKIHQNPMPSRLELCIIVRFYMFVALITKTSVLKCSPNAINYIQMAAVLPQEQKQPSKI